MKNLLKNKNRIIIVIFSFLLILFFLFKGNIQGFIDLKYKSLTRFDGKVEFTGTIELIDFYNPGNGIGGLVTSKYRIKNISNKKIYYFSETAPMPYNYDGNKNIVLDFDGSGDYRINIK